MATKSFLKNVNIKGKKNVRCLVDALEKSEKFQSEPVVMSRPVRELRGDELHGFLEKLHMPGDNRHA